jgi:hypothetical protein
MQRTHISIQTTDSRKIVEAYISEGFPGISIHRTIWNDDLWTATHTPSGVAIFTRFGRRKDAVQYAKEAAALTDFTVSEEKLSAHVNRRVKLRRRLREMANELAA